MRQAHTITDNPFLLNLAGSVSLTAAIIHALVMPEHFQEWWGYGVFFYVVTVAQTLYAVALLFRAWDVHSIGMFEYIWNHHLQSFYVAGIVGNSVLIVLYVITRTIGMPAGPDVGQIETFSALSIVSKVLEVFLIGCVVILLAKARTRSH